MQNTHKIRTKTINSASVATNLKMLHVFPIPDSWYWKTKKLNGKSGLNCWDLYVGGHRPGHGHRHRHWHWLLQGSDSVILFLLWWMDGNQIWNGFSRALLALGIPIKHNFHLDPKNTLQKIIGYKLQSEYSKQADVIQLVPGTARTRSCVRLDSKPEPKGKSSDLSQKHMPHSRVNVFLDRLTRWNHVPILEFHRFGTLSPKLAANNNLDISTKYYHVVSEFYII